MPEALYLALAAVAAYAGFACFALSQPRHWRAVTGSDAAGTRLRAAGCALLIASAGLAVVRDGPSFGAVLAVLLWITSAWAVAFTLTWRPHWLRPLAVLLGSVRASAR